MRFAILSILVALLCLGCGERESALIGRWEGTTENSHRVILNIKADGKGELSKIGGYPNHPIAWIAFRDRVDIVNGDKLIMRLSVTDGGLIDPNGFRLQRPGPFSGFRFPALTAVIAMLVSLFLTPLVRRMAFKYGAVDDPKRDDRRVHKEPLPRWGGIAIYVGFIVAILTMIPWAFPGRAQPFPLYLIGIAGIGTLILIVGALDDIKQYSAKIQAVVLLLAGGAITFFGTSDHNKVVIAGN